MVSGKDSRKWRTPGPVDPMKAVCRSSVRPATTFIIFAGGSNTSGPTGADVLNNVQGGVPCDFGLLATRRRIECQRPPERRLGALGTPKKASPGPIWDPARLLLDFIASAVENLFLQPYVTFVSLRRSLRPGRSP